MCLSTVFFSSFRCCFCCCPSVHLIFLSVFFAVLVVFFSIYSQNFCVYFVQLEYVWDTIYRDFFVVRRPNLFQNAVWYRKFPFEIKQKRMSKSGFNQFLHWSTVQFKSNYSVVKCDFLRVFFSIVWVALAVWESEH